MAQQLKAWWDIEGPPERPFLQPRWCHYNPFKQSFINEICEIITGLVILKFNTAGKIRIIGTALIGSFKRLEKLVEGDFLLYPVHNFNCTVITTKSCYFLPEFAVYVKLTSNENIRVEETKAWTIRDNIPSTDALNEIVVEKKKSLPFLPPVATYPVLPTQWP